MKPNILWFAFGVWTLMGALALPVFCVDDSKHRAQLAAQGIDPSAAGVRTFFAEVTRESADTALLQRIDQLGSSNYAERIEAQRFLMRQAQLPLDHLRKAETSANPEVAYRAAIILKNWIPERERTIEAALWLVADEKLSGLSTDVFSVVTVFRDREKIIRAGEQALVGTVQNAELPMLISHIDGHDPLLGHLALSGFISIADVAQADRMLDWAERDAFKEADRLKLALAVARFNDKRALPVLVGLLAVGDKLVGVRASVALQNLTGQKIRFSNADPASVEQATNQWNKWLADSTDSFEMKLDSLDAKSRRSNLNGNLLLALGYKNQVIELNSNGDEVWKFDAMGVWSAEKTANGDVLLACYQENKVKLVSPQKTVSWEYDVPGVLKAHALENGNILAASHSGNKVVEVSPDKKVVWEYAAGTQCHDAIRLENGDTLVCAANEVLEVDPSGNVLWKFPAEQAYGIDALPSGNVLIAKLGGEVIEVDRTSNAIVWTYEFASPVDVYRTDEGTTLVTGAQTVVEIDAEKNVLWTKDICNFGSARK